MEHERKRAHLAWRNAERIKRLSDRLVGIGPFGLGLDGVLAWVPIAGPAYSVGAGGLLIHEALRAKASSATVARMAAYLVLDSASSGVPILGWAFDTFFRGHAMAAGALQKDIEARHGASPASADLGPNARRARRNKADGQYEQANRGPTDAPEPAPASVQRRAASRRRPASAGYRAAR
jgi:hypothetical protein